MFYHKSTILDGVVLFLVKYHGIHHGKCPAGGKELIHELKPKAREDDELACPSEQAILQRKRSECVDELRVVTNHDHHCATHCPSDLLVTLTSKLICHAII